MNPGILVSANLLLFALFCALGFRTAHQLTNRSIGFFYGGRFAVFTPEDAISQKKHRLLTLLIAVLALALSFACYIVLGEFSWSSFALAPTLGSELGIFAAYKNDKGHLLPAGWPPR